jgi:U3 small nucleolar ribonucleoprotein component
MPLGKDIGKNIKELEADNKKKGKAKGAGGKKRPMKQILAIALEAARGAKK